MNTATLRARLDAVATEIFRFEDCGPEALDRALRAAATRCHAIPEPVVERSPESDNDAVTPAHAAVSARRGPAGGASDGRGGTGGATRSAG